MNRLGPQRVPLPGRLPPRLGHGVGAEREHLAAGGSRALAGRHRPWQPEPLLASSSSGQLGPLSKMAQDWLAVLSSDELSAKCVIRVSSCNP